MPLLKQKKKQKQQKRGNKINVLQALYQKARNDHHGNADGIYRGYRFLF